MQSDEILYFGNVRYEQQFGPVAFWDEVRTQSGPGGKFFIDLGKRLSPSRFVARAGEWSLPWNQQLMPGFEMPEYDPNFSKSFSDITDDRALYVRDLIRQGKKVAVMYSGGMDSTLVLLSLIKNLSEEELKSVAVSTSVHAMIENPHVWNKYIQGKFTIIESIYNWYDDIINAGYMPITADEGDCIMGTSIGLQVYHNYDAYIHNLSAETREKLRPLKYKIATGDVHFSVYKDIIIKHLAYNQSPEGLEFGRLLYEKYVHNANTSNVPVYSLHDFFWWLIFNVKYLNCSVRGAIFFNDSLGIKECLDQTINWFNGTDYQRWSMANNNNGQKIRNTVATYKYAAREYLKDIDNNEWYFYFKTKLESLSNLRTKGKIHNMRFQNRHIIGVNNKYEWLCFDEPGVADFFKDKITNYQIDWPN